MVFGVELLGQSVDGRDLLLLAGPRKELQISKSISVPSGFISDLFPRKRMGLAKVGAGVKAGSGQSKVSKIGVAEGRVA